MRPKECRFAVAVSVFREGPASALINVTHADEPFANLEQTACQ